MFPNRITYLLFKIFLVSFCFCELSLERRDKLLNGFLEYYNKLPNQEYTCEVGYLQNAQKINENCYRIEVVIKAVQSEATKYFKCITTLQELPDNAINVMNNEYECTEQENYDGGSYEEVVSVITTEEPFVRRPVQLDNEVETTAVTSGEQFIAIPKSQPNAPCIGCSTHINPQAAGVTELAALGAKQLDRHVPNVKHIVSDVLDVERQVQVVNGVRYILTLLIDFDVCKEEKTDLCKSTQTCKVTILEKPWVRYGDGSKYRAILSNNCTEDWRFGDDGEVIVDISNTNKEKNEIDTNPSRQNSGDDVIKPVTNTEVQSQQIQEKVLTEEDIKKIELQVIPLSKFNINFDATSNSGPEASVNTEITKENSQQTESTTPFSDKIAQVDETGSTISDTKKKAIDDLLSFFDSAGFNNEPLHQENVGRIRRSYDNDLSAMLFAERFTNIKQNVNNAKHVYSVAQTMVDYLNEMNSNFKLKSLLNVLKAEEEYDGINHYFYIQARVSVPCDKFDCESKGTETKLCNGVIDTTKPNFKVISAFCSSETDVSDFDKIENVPVDDPVLKYLAKLALKKIEKSSEGNNALKLTKILTANTQKVSGTLTKLSVILGFLNCSKTVLDTSRHNCVLKEDMGTNLCEILIHDKHRMKDQRITYTCINRPTHVTFSNKLKKACNFDDPKINNMVQDALKHLEKESNKRNKQKIVSVNSIKTQLNAGFLIEIDFTVGYTSCTDNEIVDIIESCSLLENEPLRNCKTLIWDRSWIEDGTQMEVSCSDPEITYDGDGLLTFRAKRSLDFVGGPEPRDASDPQYKALADESVEMFMVSSGEKQHYSVVKVKEVTVQVVSGTLTRLKFSITPTTCQIDSSGRPSSTNCIIINSTVTADCNSKIWYRPWLKNSKQIFVTCDSEKIKHRSRREAVLGGVREKDPSDPHYFALAEESLKQYLQTSGIPAPYKVVTVIKVTTQVVAGLLTKLDFTVSPVAGDAGDSGKCESSVWEQPWLKKKEITVTCNYLNRSKRQMPGAPFDQDPNDPKYKALAEESLKQYLETSGISEPHEVVTMNNVTTQVVAGSLTKLDFTFSPVAGYAGDSGNCKSSVWERPWLKKKEITVTCNIPNRSKRQITGAPIDQDPNDPKYKALAEESLKQYLETSGISEPHEVVTMNNVTTQVVAGSLTKLDFTVSPVAGDAGDSGKCESSVWEQPWLKKKEITVTCNYLNRSKRQMPGAPIDQDPNDPKYKALAEESLKQYLETSGISEPHEVVTMNNVTTQVVAGSLTKLDFTFSPVAGYAGDSGNCKSSVWERPWLKKKEITVTCNIPNRSKRQITGAPIDQDPNDPKYKALAEESLKQYLETSGISEPHEVATMNKVTTQVVAGSLTKLDFTFSPVAGYAGDSGNCKSSVWEQPWLKKKEITVTCNYLNRSKRQMPGAPIDQDPNDPKYKALAEESLKQYLETSGISEPHEVATMNKVTTQVVAGSLTKLDFTFSPVAGYAGDSGNCKSSVWEQPWLKKKEITVTCNYLNRSKRQMPGAPIDQDPNDPKYKALAEESLKQYLETSGISEPHEVATMNKVTTQVVAGSLTKLDFTFSPVAGYAGDSGNCKSSVWKQPWLKKKEITVTCNYLNRSKRQMPGAPIDQDPNDPKYKALAEESLKQYLETSGISEPHEVATMNKVTTQVVAGSLTKLDFTFSPVAGYAGDSGNCKSSVWEQPWLKKKEITVTCNYLNRSKRQMPGAPIDQDPNDPKYKALAEESLKQYLETSGISEPHEVATMNKVTTQVVAGSLTKLDFTFSPVAGYAGDSGNCKSSVWEQPWLKKKEITVTCNYLNRSKRQMPGAPIDQDPNDPKYKALAEESLKQYLETSGISEPHEVATMNKVTTQVVAGSLTKLDFTFSPVAGYAGDSGNCKSSVWKQPWLKKKEITVTCNYLNRSKRQMPGAPIDQDPNDPKYKALAEESLKQYLETSGISEPHEVATMNKVTTQVVAGSLTRLEFTVSPVGGGTRNTTKCESQVWEQPWLEKIKINVYCDFHNEKQVIKNFGRFIEKDPSESQFMILAEEALEKYLLISGIKRPHKVMKVNKVMTQVVSGLHTLIHFTVIPDDGSSEDMLTCRTDIWEKAWYKKDIDIECKFLSLSSHNVDTAVVNNLKNESPYNNITRKKRATLDYGKPNIFGRRPTFNNSNNSEATKLGGEQERNSSKKEYKILAQKSLQQYVMSKSIDKAHRVIEVTRVRTKVVSGIRYKIDFQAAPTSCSVNVDAFTLDRCILNTDAVIFCRAAILSQPWLHKDEIEITCKPKRNESNVVTARKSKKINHKTRYRRQANHDEDDIEDDNKHYYADAAVQRLNQVTDSHNLYKLITIHTAKKRTLKDSNLILMYIEVAQTYCLRHADEGILSECEELDGIDHKNCLARLTPSPDDELIIIHTHVVCDDDAKFEDVTGISLSKLLQASINKIENSPQVKNKLVHTGDPQWIPTLDPDVPVKLNFIVASTNCSKDVDYIKKRTECFYDVSFPSKVCSSYIWLAPFTNKIDYVQASCQSTNPRAKRSFGENAIGNDTILINQLIQLSLDKLEMTSQHRYKQRLLRINSYSTKITSGKVTTIDFDVGYTSCLKYEWVENVTSCEFLEHLPRRHCVSQIWERLWINNGRNIEVNCEDDETPLESHIEFESAEMGMQLAKQALKHIEAKYPNPRKQQVVRIFTLEKQVVAGIHYRMKIEVAATNCFALSAETDCKIDKDAGLNKFCRVNVWLRPWTDHPPNFRVQCDYQDTSTADLYRHVQAEHLFFNFMTTYKPEYVNDHREMGRRFDIFKANIQKIHNLNIHERGTATYGVTRFADLTYEEFSTKYMGLKPSLKEDNQMPFRQASIPNVETPESFDWRDYDAVTAVKDQGSCGSCWAFSVTGNVEGQWKMQSGQLLSLSEQELVDCDKLDQGCNGGYMDNAYRSIEQLGGLELENDYPYEGEDDKCVFNKTLSKVQISGAVNISSNETDMVKWLVKNGPISIGINANAMQFYMGGISHPWRMLCNPKNLDHGVLVVGYGIKDYPLFNKRLPYWIVKNSWGASWGEQGYYRVFRGDGTCGVNQMASSAVI